MQVTAYNKQQYTIVLSTPILMSILSESMQILTAILPSINQTTDALVRSNFRGRRTASLYTKPAAEAVT